MMMMMCNDLMCTFKLPRSQLSLAHNAKVKTDMPEKKWKTIGVHGVSPVGVKVEEGICGKEEFWAWSGREKE